MDKNKTIYYGIGATAVWGLANVGAAIIEAITPKGAKALHKVGIAVGGSVIGAFALNKMVDAYNNMLRNRDIESDESTKMNESDETET